MTRSTPRPTSRAHELSTAEQEVYSQLDHERIPRHVAIIMDGNGRWAGRRNLKRFFGHQQGAEAVQFVVETASRIDLPWLTLYAFSLENNLRRPRSEVNFLMKLLKSYLVGNVQRMNDNNIRMAYIGRTSELPSEVQETMRWASEATAKNTGTTLTLALNYGARSEIVDSVRSAASSVVEQAIRQGLSLEDVLFRIGQIDEESIGGCLYTSHMPDPDLIVRTSGEQRVSNFMLWQIAYSEIFVTDRLWPDFRGIHLLEAIADYQRRERRFGGLGENPTDEKLPDPPDALALDRQTSELVRH